ncbi:hypothetical protein BpHYR1_052592 [Brachionus plicatilis]|uniref:Uncharacterized protein n=1 Tax=Brachionus plicatilis TaxID=10195 RepID=A0A3M7Q2R0_BRAPC|nr:hypothetical protein BpHYR1_052592 [Brachionus plicatilis]
MVADRWANRGSAVLPSEYLKSSWHKLNLNIRNELTLDDIDLSQIRSDLNVFGLNFSDIALKDWLENDKNDSGYQLMNDEEIVQSTLESTQSDSENEEPEEEDFTVTEPEPVISNSSAITMCDELKKFYIKSNIPIDQEMFSSIKTSATNAKQSSIRNFFKPNQVQSTSINLPFLNKILSQKILSFNFRDKTLFRSTDIIYLGELSSILLNLVNIK